MQTASVLSYQAVEVIAQASRTAPRTPTPRELRDAIADLQSTSRCSPSTDPIEFDDTGQNEQRDGRGDADPGHESSRSTPTEFETDQVIQLPAAPAA